MAENASTDPTPWPAEAVAGMALGCLLGAPAYRASSPTWSFTMAVPAAFTEVMTVIQALTGVVAVGAGIRAWSNWKLQLRNTEDHKMAQELLKEAYRLRDGIQFIRNPFMWTRRFDEAGRELTSDQRHDDRVKAYEERLKEAASRKTNLEVKITEAEALWGEPVREWCMPLIKTHSTLVANVFTMLDLESPRVTETVRMQQRELLDKAREIAYLGATLEPDEFEKKVIQALNSIRTSLKPKMISHTKPGPSSSPPPTQHPT